MEKGEVLIPNTLLNATKSEIDADESDTLECYSVDHGIPSPVTLYSHRC